MCPPGFYDDVIGCEACVPLCDSCTNGNSCDACIQYAKFDPKENKCECNRNFKYWLPTNKCYLTQVCVDDILFLKHQAQQLDVFVLPIGEVTKLPNNFL